MYFGHGEKKAKSRILRCVAAVQAESPRVVYGRLSLLLGGAEVANLAQEFGHKKSREDRGFLCAIVPRAGLEPARPKGHMALNHACLPISAPGLVTPLGLEPRTLSLKVRCSNQLS